MTLPKTDAFTAADQTLHNYDANWVMNWGVIDIVSNHLQESIGGSVGHWEGDVFEDDQEVIVTLSPLISGYVLAGAAVRVGQGATPQAYIFMACAANSYLYYLSSGGFGLIGGDRGAFAQGDKLKLRVTGQGANISLKGYRYTGGAWGSALFDVTPTVQYNSGYGGIGLGIQGPGTYDNIDDFEGGNVGAAGGLPIPVVIADYRQMRN
jgi:hypothetical protein